MRMCLRMIVMALGVCALLMASVGCAKNPKNIDPFEKANRGLYKFNDGLDRVLLKPGADLYVKVVPQPVRQGISNAFDNLGYGNVIVNDLLQGKFGPALGGVGRVGLNTTVGLLGTMDVATKWGLPAHGNDFGITIGKWGAGPGPYLVLPLLGPSTFRDVTRIPVSMVTSPMYYLDVPDVVSIPMDVVRIADGRSRADSTIEFRDKAAIDPYVFVRDAYLQNRKVQIYGVEATAPGEDFYGEDDGSGPTTQAVKAPEVKESAPKRRRGPRMGKY